MLCAVPAGLFRCLRGNPARTAQFSGLPRGDLAPPRVVPERTAHSSRGSRRFTARGPRVMPLSATQELSSGRTMPRVGLGTWLAKPGEVAKAVEIALLNGYRHIDCAMAYENQPEIGEVFNRLFSEGKVKREDVFITSKVWNTYHSYAKAKEAVDIILKELQLEYIDLVLVHWPMGYEEGAEIFPKNADGSKMRYSSEDYLDTWKALEEAVEAGKIRSIGISNFNHNQIQRVIDNSKIKPAALQVELHPYFQQRRLREFCKQKNIVVTAYSSLGNPSMPFRKDGDASIFTEKTILDIAAKHGKSAAHVALRWAMQHDIQVIPKSINEARIVDNAKLFDFELSADEMAAVDALDRDWRILDLTFRDNDHPHFPWNDKSDF